MTRLLSLIRALLGTLMLAAVAINFANVVGRYAFSAPIFWAEEALVFMNVWCVLLGAGIVAHANAHLRMDAFEAIAPPRVKRWIDVAAAHHDALAGAPGHFGAYRFFLSHGFPG